LQATFAPNRLTVKTKADAELKKGQAPGRFPDPIWARRQRRGIDNRQVIYYPPYFILL